MKGRTALALLLLVAGCGPAPEAPASDGTWVGTITTEGNVTTVVSESGSVWGGTATLVEEASIGVEAGADEYVLGRIASVAAGDDRIYVLDRRGPVLRVYDFAGTHVMNIGRPGRGLGEFGLLASVAVAPNETIFVRDVGNSRFSVFDRDGVLVDTWPTDEGGATMWETVISADGTPYVPSGLGPDPTTHRGGIGFVPYGPEGALGEPLMPPDFGYEQPRLRSGPLSGPVPFFPRQVTVVSPLGAVVSGIGNEYEIEVRYFDGRVTRIVREAPPVPLSADEAAWYERAETAHMREPDPSWSWSGPGVPDRKPYFDELYADASGRIWVSRSGPSNRVADCEENPAPGVAYTACWENTTFTEVFDADGRFLGGIDFPRQDGFQRNFMRDDTVIKQVEDEAGTIMVKRYRLVLPGEQEE